MQKTFENFKRDYREDILKENMKKVTSFFPLRSVPLYGQGHEKRSVELVTNLRQRLLIPNLDLSEKIGKVVPK